MTRTRTKVWNFDNLEFLFFVLYTSMVPCLFGKSCKLSTFLKNLARKKLPCKILQVIAFLQGSCKILARNAFSFNQGSGGVLLILLRFLASGSASFQWCQCITVGQHCSLQKWTFRCPNIFVNHISKTGRILKWSCKTGCIPFSFVESALESKPPWIESRSYLAIKQKKAAVIFE